jgi:hypothetical protein
VEFDGGYNFSRYVHTCILYYIILIVILTNISNHPLSAPLEALSHPDFRRRLMRMAIDQFHLTIMEWQHFRPQFRKLSGFRQLIPKRVPSLGVLATLSQIFLDKNIPSTPRELGESGWLS